MKKFSIFLLIFLIFCITSICLISCNQNNVEHQKESYNIEDINYDIYEKYGMNIPSKDYQPSFIDMGAYEWKYTTEKDFNNMVITFEKDIFDHDEIIKIKIENKNGLTFNLLSYPYVEYFNPEKQEWVRLAYYPDEYSFEKFRVRNLKAINNLSTLIMIATSFITYLVINKNKVYHACLDTYSAFVKNKQDKEIIEQYGQNGLMLYRVKRGIQTILEHSNSVPVVPGRDQSKPKTNQMSFFDMKLK